MSFASHPFTIGVVGAGQLARMMLAPAAALDIHLYVLTKNLDDPAVKAGAKAMIGDPNDSQTLQTFARQCDVVTFEHELISPTTLKLVNEVPGVLMQPDPSSKIFAQDKHEQRRFLSAKHPEWVPAWQLVTTQEDISLFGQEHGWPVVVKAARGGYDGRGVWFLNNTEEASALWQKTKQQDIQFLVERCVAIDHELAVLVARNQRGEIQCYPPVETIQRDGICHEVVAPAFASPDILRQAEQLATTIANDIQSTGILAVELFLENEQLLINELALRPHNTGHLTIEGCVTSQFENHLRGVANLPLGSTRLTAQTAVMVNVLGWSETVAPQKNLGRALKNQDAHIHLYGKTPRPGRKLGHVTLLGNDRESTRRQARNVVDDLSRNSA